MWVMAILTISAIIFALCVVIGIIAFTVTKDSENIISGLQAGLSLYIIINLLVGIIPMSIGTWNTGKLDPKTATYSVGTAEDLVGAKQTFRDCAPGDAKFTLVTGKENDVSFWVGGPPPEYREVLICRD